MIKGRILVGALAGMLALSAIPVVALSQDGMSDGMSPDVTSQPRSVEPSAPKAAISHKPVSGVMPAEMRQSEATARVKGSKLSTSKHGVRTLSKLSHKSKLSSRRHSAKTLLVKTHKAKTLSKKGKHKHHKKPA